MDVKGKKDDGAKPKKVKKELIEFVDGKRSYTVSIAITRMRMSNDDIYAAVLSLDEEVLNLEKLGNLFKVWCIAFLCEGRQLGAF